MEKGQTVEIYIHDMSHEGKGIGYCDGMTVFAEGAVIGDTVSARLTKIKKTYAFAETVQIKQESDSRTPPHCPYSDVCGGCSLSALDYKKQGEIKAKQVRDKLERIAGIENPAVREMIQMERPYRYRNKAEMPVRGGCVGFFEAGSHRVCDIPDCIIQSEAAMAAAQAVRDSGENCIRHLVIKTAFGTGQVMVILVTDGELKDAAKLARAIDDAIYAIGDIYSLESVYINRKKSSDRGRNVLGSEYILLAGSRTITEETVGLKFEISPASFYQVNPQQMIKLYDRAIEYMNLSGSETVLDLYCGVGTIGIFAARRAGQIIGIEAVKDAVIDANRNAVINGIVNARYITGRAEEVLPALIGYGEDSAALEKWQKWFEQQEIHMDRADVAVIDPPRTGCDERLLEALAKAEPERIVYVSCDPATMARDIARLTGAGYRFEEATPVDMFPWTGSIETVALLAKKQAAPKGEAAK
jgi:23S rRNA (uracil1939-C5)-methyltransferase